MRLKLYRRNWRAVCIQLILPPILLTVGLFLQSKQSFSPPSSPPALTLSPSMYGGDVPFSTTAAANWSGVLRSWPLPLVNVSSPAFAGEMILEGYVKMKKESFTVHKVVGLSIFFIKRNCMSDPPCHSALFPTCCIEYLANHDMLTAAFDLTATPTMYFNATRTHALPAYLQSFYSAVLTSVNGERVRSSRNLKSTLSS